MKLSEIVLSLSLALGSASCGTISLPPVSNPEIQSFQEKLVQEIPKTVADQFNEDETESKGLNIYPLDPKILEDFEKKI